MAKGVKRSRLDAELVRRGLARSREQASELIAAGKVKVSGTVATKPATGVGADAPILVDTSETDDPGYACHAADPGQACRRAAGWPHAAGFGDDPSQWAARHLRHLDGADHLPVL